MSDGCGNCAGHCCALFWWSRTPGQLAHYPEQAGGETVEESRFIADMLIPLGPHQVQERIEKYDLPHTLEEVFKEKDRQPYTCRHWDEPSRLCTAYEERPQMCRDYPYGNGCSHGCGYEIPPHALAAYDRRRIEAGRTKIVLGEN